MDHRIDAPPQGRMTEKRGRDIRLDLFRGLAMLIIVIAHMRDNPWNQFIPARFGFSSAAEMFVFCSGLASALAFGAIFVKRGWWLGTARIAYRIWQLYWAQIVPFLIIIAISAWATRELGLRDYLEVLNVGWLVTNPTEALLALMTLRYVPTYFDMLPLYMLLLASLPLVMGLSRLSRLAPLALSVALWLFVQLTHINLPAKPESDWVWYFNPFAWQLLFIAGFSFGMGWLPAPRLRHRPLVTGALAIVIAMVPISFWAITDHVPELAHVAPALGYENAPTSLHPLRLIHFAAVAYLALSAIEPWRGRLAQIIWLKPIEKVGQQTLAAFLASLPIAWVLGIALDWSGRDALTVTLANLAALGGIIAVAYVTGWFKSQPWRAERSKVVPAPAAPHASRAASLPHPAQ